TERFTLYAKFWGRILSGIVGQVGNLGPMGNRPGRWRADGTTRPPRQAVSRGASVSADRPDPAREPSRLRSNQSDRSDYGAALAGWNPSIHRSSVGYASPSRAPSH